jgi:hypothetical protein
VSEVDGILSRPRGHYDGAVLFYPVIVGQEYRDTAGAFVVFSADGSTDGADGLLGRAAWFNHFR